VTDRRRFVQACAIVLGGASLAAHGQKSGPLPRIGLLVPGAGAAEQPLLQGLRELGYVDGKTIVIERRSAEGDFSKLPALAADLVRTQPSLIVSVVTQASIAAKEATSTIPIVIAAVGDPVAAGLVGNLARPGGNITGTAGASHVTVGKLLELVRELLPRAERVSVLWNPANAVFQQQQLGEALIGASRLRMLAIPVSARSVTELERAFYDIASDKPDAMILLPDALTIGNRGRIAEWAIAGRLPLFSTTRQMAEAGLLAAYGPDLAAAGKRAAIYVQKILRGAKPGDLPIELPTQFELVINLKTATAVGVDVPTSVIARANEVIR
jgi:putative ABC transport system substrate-binding protein